MYRIITADVMDGLAQLEDASVHCVVTSPPYWWLRDYGVAGQIGLEETPQEYVSRMVEVFREVRRVLRPDGTAWVNLGDTYRRKRLVGIPSRVALALQDDGWYWRRDIVWYKNNALPESTKDRPSGAHEYIFLLSQQPQYYYDPDAIREPHQPESSVRWPQGGHQTGRTKYRGLPVGVPRVGSGNLHEGSNHLHPAGRNARSVWIIPTEPFPEAHFATFPRELPRRCILAGTSPRACPICGAPWARVVERTGHRNGREPAHVPHNTKTKTDSTDWRPTTAPTNQWAPTCICPDNDGSGRCVVLDPFCGAGTTLLVAEQYGRDSIGIEINPEYVQMARRRIERETQQQRIFAGVT